MKEYTHKERAVNLAMEFASITNDSTITNYAKQSAIVAINRNIDNISIMVKNLSDAGHDYSSGLFNILLEDEKSLLIEIENI